MRVNLLPKELRPFNPRPVIAVVLLLLIGLVAPLLYFTREAQQTIVEQQERITQLQVRLMTLEDISALVTERNSLQRQWNQVVASRPGRRQLLVTEQLEKLTALLPRDVYLTEINHDHANITMRAFAPDYQTMVQFVGAIAASPHFGDTPRLSGLSGSAGGYTFSVAVPVMGGER